MDFPVGDKPCVSEPAITPTKSDKSKEIADGDPQESLHLCPHEGSLFLDVDPTDPNRTVLTDTRSLIQTSARLGR